MQAAKKVPDFIQRLTKPDDIKAVMKNAKNQNNEDAYWAAFEQLCKVQGLSYPIELEKDFHMMLAAYEALLSEKNDRNQPASRTRQKLARLGVKKCLEDWALAKKETPGFLLLVENNKAHFTAEAVVVKHAHLFSEEVVKAAKQRLQSHGIDYSQYGTA